MITHNGECTLVIGGEEYLVRSFDIDIDYDQQNAHTRIMNTTIVVKGDVYHAETGRKLGEK